MAKKRKTNAQIIKEMLDINKAYLAENPYNESLLSPKFEQVMEEVLNTSEDEAFINVELNRRLKVNK